MEYVSLLTALLLPYDFLLLKYRNISSLFKFVFALLYQCPQKASNIITECYQMVCQQNSPVAISPFRVLCRLREVVRHVKHLTVQALGSSQTPVPSLPARGRLTYV